METNQSDKQLNSVTLLNQMMSDPYYLFHFLVFFSYIPVRCAASQVFSPLFSSYLLHREIQAVIAFSVLTVVKVVREETWEAFIADTLFFAKIFLFGIALVVDYHLALWYMLAFLVIYILTQPPPYQGIGATLQLTPLQLEALLTDGNTSRFWLVSGAAVHKLLRARSMKPLPGGENMLLFSIVACMAISSSCSFIEMSSLLPSLQDNSVTEDPRRFLTVECRALSSSTCIQASRVFPELSITYSNKNLSFGIVDLGLFPNTAEKFGISLGSINRLPTYILFENGVEITRFPELDFEAKTSTSTITKKLLCCHFELDRHLIDYINSK